MKRKEDAALEEMSSVSENEDGTQNSEGQEDTDVSEDRRLFLMEDGRLKPFSSQDYTTSTLYQVVETFEVERRLVPPETPGNVSFEGKKPSKKTVPIIVFKEGHCTLLDSWEDLENRTSELANAQEVIGAIPVKQVFVLKKK